MTRCVLSLLIGAISVASCTRPTTPSSESPSAFSSLTPGQLVDLSHAYDETTLFWPTARPFALEKVADGVTPDGYYYAANNFSRPNTAARTSTRPSTSRKGH